MPNRMPRSRSVLRASPASTSASTSCPARYRSRRRRRPAVDPDLAAEIVWFDAYVTNIDRTARNPNLLRWHRRLHLIDHGAALYFHHDDRRVPGFERSAFPAIADHVLLPYAGSIAAADERLAHQLDDALIERVIALVPDAFLAGDDRWVYSDYLRERLDASRVFVEAADRARP